MVKNKKKKICAIIQARTGSERLPGKVLMNIEGRSMLWHIIERLKKSQKINGIILAIPDTKKNEILEKFAKENYIKYYCGSEENVLERYYKASKNFGIDIIVRITADNPLIDPEIIDKGVEKHLKSKADFTASFEDGVVSKRTFPMGIDVEIFNFSALERANQEAEHSYQKEHVTEYFFENPNKFRLNLFENKDDFSDFRWTVDEEKDLQFVREIYKKLYRKDKIFLMEDVVALLKKYPELSKINNDVEQKIV